MSLFQDIGTYLGSGSVPVIVGAFVYGVFELGEKLTSPQAKTALTHWLQTADVRKVRGLPQYTKEIFERFFGERHFSLKCFWRSAAFSVGSVLVIFYVIQLILGISVFPLMIDYREFEFAIVLAALIWLSWAILIDYLSLLKTRLFLSYFIKAKPRIRLSVLFGDLLIYVVLFVTGLFINDRFLELVFPQTFITMANGIPIEELTSVTQVIIPTYFLSGFAPSAWLWLYVAALFVTRSFLRSEPIVNRLRWLLDIEKAPFRSIGAVAAALAFIGSAVVLIVARVV